MRQPQYEAGWQASSTFTEGALFLANLSDGPETVFLGKPQLVDMLLEPLTGLIKPPLALLRSQLLPPFRLRRNILLGLFETALISSSVMSSPLAFGPVAGVGQAGFPRALHRLAGRIALFCAHSVMLPQPESSGNQWHPGEAFRSNDYQTPYWACAGSVTSPCPASQPKP